MPRGDFLNLSIANEIQNRAALSYTINGFAELSATEMETVDGRFKPLEFIGGVSLAGGLVGYGV